MKNAAAKDTQEMAESDLLSTALMYLDSQPDISRSIARQMISKTSLQDTMREIISKTECPVMRELAMAYYVRNYSR